MLDLVNYFHSSSYLFFIFFFFFLSIWCKVEISVHQQMAERVKARNAIAGRRYYAIGTCFLYPKSVIWSSVVVDFHVFIFFADISWYN